MSIFMSIFTHSSQLMLGIPEQALVLVQDVLESVLAHGALIDKGRALLLAARCQMALAGTTAEENRLSGTESSFSPITTLKGRLEVGL